MTDALCEALRSDLSLELGDAAPSVLYAWVRPILAGGSDAVVMFAKVRCRHRSAVLESSGVDADTAYLALVERCASWTGERQQA